MAAFGRSIGTFFLMMVIGYLAVVLFLPAPNPTFTSPDDLVTGRSASVRLTEQAQALVARKPAASLQ